MKAGKIWAAGLDVTVDEPLPESSPLWTMPNVFITPHTAGETRAYEDNVIDILIENLDRLWRGEAVDFPTQDGTFAVKTQPRPVSKELPIWVTTAGNPETWRDAGRVGANVLTHEQASAQRRGLAIALQSLAFALGVSLGGVLAHLFNASLGWRYVFLAGSLITFVVTLAGVVWLIGPAGRL